MSKNITQEQFKQLMDKMEEVVTKVDTLKDEFYRHKQEVAVELGDMWKNAFKNVSGVLSFKPNEPSNSDEEWRLLTHLSPQQHLSNQ